MLFRSKPYGKLSYFYLFSVQRLGLTLVRSISRVIKSFHSPADPNGTWKVASEFLHMHEDDRDRVVKIVLAEQAKMLRERKKQQYDDLN